ASRPDARTASGAAKHAILIQPQGAAECRYETRNLKEPNSMSDQTFDDLQKIHSSKGPAAAIDHLIGVLRDEKRFHQLFDSLLMKKRLELGLALVRPTSLKDVPDDRRDEFEKVYIDTARQVGELLLADGSIPQAWHYFRAINEPQQVGGREWLFNDDSYHIDVSHLNSVVRFARFLDAGCPELDLALQLAQYGSRLAQQYQYAGNPPFDDFYPAHIRYFKVLLDIERE